MNPETEKAATQMGAQAVAEIKFSKDSTELTDKSKAELQLAIAEASKKGTIKEVRIATWADQEYPAAKTPVAKSQVSLAEKRALGIRSYLENNLKVTSVRTLNMAERPNELQKALNTPVAQAKNELESTGAAPTRTDQTGLFGLKGKSSEAVILIFME